MQWHKQCIDHIFWTFSFNRDKIELFFPLIVLAPSLPNPIKFFKYSSPKIPEFSINLYNS